MWKGYLENHNALKGNYPNVTRVELDLSSEEMQSQDLTLDIDSDIVRKFPKEKHKDWDQLAMFWGELINHDNYVAKVTRLRNAANVR